MANDISQLITNPELAGLERQRKMAQMLVQQGMQTPQSQMVGDRYVPANPLQYLGNLFNVYAGQKGLEDIDKKELSMAQALRQKEISDLNRFAELQYGTPDQMVQQAGPMMDGGNIAPQMVQGQAPNLIDAFKFGAQSTNPLVRSQLAEMLKPQKFAEGEVLQRLNLASGKMETVGQGGQKVAPEMRQAMQFLGINKPLEELSQQELQAIEKKAIEFKKAGANNISLNLPSESERKAGTMSNILDKNIQQMQVALGVDPTAAKPNVPASVVESIAGPNLLSRSMKPAQRQIIEDSQLDVLDAALTLRTGAAYTKEQLEGMRDTYFPKLGDKPATVQAKKQRLETLLDSAYISSGRATPPRTSAPYQAPPTQPNVNQQLNIPNMKLPPGVTQQLWNVMTPEEKAAFK
jgi:hypothetical protein